MSRGKKKLPVKGVRRQRRIIKKIRMLCRSMKKNIKKKKEGGRMKKKKMR